MSIFTKIGRRYDSLKQRAIGLWQYCARDVWNDTRSTFPVNIVKTLNLSVKSFFNSDIQSKACAMTYRTILALVPALALLFAIGKGFGLQDLLRDELVSAVPGEAKALTSIFNYVDNYLNESSSGGLFVGLGIVLLLWTLVSLLGSVENAFNSIWGVKEGRSTWRKMTDYLAIFLILPILMICAGGLTAFVTSVTDNMIDVKWINSTISIMLDIASLVLVWAFFTGVYMLIPNTKVRFRNAVVAGIIAGTGFMILEWLFVSGQIYVSKYNAIYGGVAFIPLFLIWIQFVWVITLSGGVICYASQNIFRYNFSKEISTISLNYRTRILMAIIAIITHRYDKGEKPVNDEELARDYGLPASLVSKTVNFLIDAGLVLRVVDDSRVEVYGLVPAIEPSVLTVSKVLCQVRNTGSTSFIPGFDENFGAVNDVVDRAVDALYNSVDDMLVKDLVINATVSDKM